ncbi:hypothetical protein MGA3_09590 [Bacillus methanolicus MGA3]|nr:hypothetical protein MGA3_09590 [Bacillus methanolicus MGA3]
MKPGDNVTPFGVLANQQVVTLCEFCRLVKKDIAGGQREVEPGEIGLRPWTVCRTWNAAPKNPSG